MMPEAPNDNAAIGWPGAALRVVAEKLGASGFETRRTGWEESRTLRVTGLYDTTCDVTADDDGFLRWEYYPGVSADPDQMAGRVMRLLTGNSLGLSGAGQGRSVPRTGLKGLVGIRLKAKGLAVCLEVYEDHVAFDVAAEVAVTNPDRPERGRVLVSDEGALMWECWYEEDTCDTADIAGVIAAILAEDIAQGCVQRAEAAPEQEPLRGPGRLARRTAADA